MSDPALALAWLKREGSSMAGLALGPRLGLSVQARASGRLYYDATSTTTLLVQPSYRLYLQSCT